MALRWPWEKREAATDYTALLSALSDAQASGSTEHASATAAVEAAAGLLSRAFAGATVQASPDVQRALGPACRALVGRDLVRRGESLHVIRMSGGRLRLHPASTWYFEGNSDPETWMVTATTYGPSGSSTWRVPWSSTIFVQWGAPSARPYHGISPTGWASETARLNANAERSLANESSGPVAQLLPVASNPKPGEGTDPVARMLSDISAAKGAALLVKTQADGHYEGRSAAPQKDWSPNRLGPAPTAEICKLAADSFTRVLAACGTPEVFWTNADGTSKREALRFWTQTTLLPCAELLQDEVRRKIEPGARIDFDSYGLDMVSRSQVVAKLTGAGVDLGVAMSAVGLADGD